jgi:membrane protein
VRSIPRVIPQIWRRVERDHCADLAAEVSFFFVLSLFPFFLVMAALVGWLPSTDLWQSFAQWVIAYFPRLSQRLLLSTILDLRHGYTGFLSVGLVTTLWSASSGFMSLMDALTIAYGRRDSRSYWKKRAIAIVATLGGAVFFILSFGVWTALHLAAVAASPEFGSIFAFEAKWKIAWWVLTTVLLFLGIDLINYFLPDVKCPWRWFSPGPLFSVISLAVASLGLNLYVRFSPMLPRVYGTLAGFIILMIWIYVATLALLIGAETDKAVDELKTQGASA